VVLGAIIGCGHRGLAAIVLADGGDAVRGRVIPATADPASAVVADQPGAPAIGAQPALGDLAFGRRQLTRLASTAGVVIGFVVVAQPASPLVTPELRGTAADVAPSVAADDPRAPAVVAEATLVPVAVGHQRPPSTPYSSLAR